MIKSGDPVEQEKQLKYASLVANAIMLSNVADMTESASMAEDGHPVTPGLVACLSPYMREHIRRFGQYVLDMDDLPGPLNPQPLPVRAGLVTTFYTYPEPTPATAAPAAVAALAAVAAAAAGAATSNLTGRATTPAAAAAAAAVAVATATSAAAAGPSTPGPTRCW